MNLTLRQRQVFELRCRDGLSRKETAERLGISDCTVRELTRQALKRNGLRGAEQVCYRMERPLPESPDRAEWV